MVTHGADLLRAGKFNHDIGISLLEIVAASIVSVLLGFVIGLVIHALPRMRRGPQPFFFRYLARPTILFFSGFLRVVWGGPLSYLAIPGVVALGSINTTTLGVLCPS